MLMNLAGKEERLVYWRTVCDTVSFAFQPVVNIHNGQTIAYEALLRDWDRAGFSSIASILDSAWDDAAIVEVNGMLLSAAIDAFLASAVARGEVGDAPPIRLFFNLDNRVFREETAGAVLLDTVFASGLPPERLTLEISELNKLPESAHTDQQLPLLRNHRIQVALDDFGTGYSGLQLLYNARSDIIKLDRFFVSGIECDSTKRIFAGNLVSMAHAIGLHVVAEGIETAQEYYACREIGCDSVQGFLIGRPSTDTGGFRGRYSVVDELIAVDRRENATTGRVLKQRIHRIPPIVQGTPILDVLHRFRTDREITFLPMVNAHNEPIGILREHDLKEYVYSPYGIALLSNQAYGHEPYSYVRRVPIVPAHSNIDRLLELSAVDNTAEALIITENGQYIGCLDSRSLLQILHERELTFARDQNPLTRLPGNTVIAERFAAALNATENWTIFTYFDFDTFKPFNDYYGFRVGDRVIQLFADRLRVQGITDHDFAGHVGGDDFFTIMTRTADRIPQAREAITELLHAFAADCRAFYEPEHLEAGGITTQDRTGHLREFPLITASAAVLIIPPHTHPSSQDVVSQEMSQLKKRAKERPGSAAVVTHAV
ncbi:MAG: GGDEF domain-containing protein [Alkalispirochaeta sp.]